MSSSTIVLTNQNELNYTSNAIKGDGYYGFADGLHTASFHVRNFTGRIWLQASLMEQSTEDDWFNIQLTVATPYFEYDNDSDTRGATFTGNFVYIRALVDRSYLVSTEYDPNVHGILDKIVLVI
jgi:hypothetical protein